MLSAIDVQNTSSKPEKNLSLKYAKFSSSTLIIVQVQVEELMRSKDLYQVWIQSGYDQAFVIGIIAVLDNIFGESTSC
jgi:hypothetical protein